MSILTEGQKSRGLISFPSDSDIEVPSPLSSLQLKTRDFLFTQYAKGDKANHTIDVDVLDGYGRGSDYLFRTYESSEDFQQFYFLAERIALSQGSTGATRERLRGALFASIAYAYLRNTETDRVVISSEATFRVAQILNPQAQEIQNPYESKGLSDVYVPDGLLMEKVNGRKIVTGVFEWSLSREYSKYVRQAEGFRRFKRDLGPTAASARFIIVVASSSIVLMPPVGPSEMDKNKDIDIVSLPFSLDDFNDYSDSVENLYRRSADHATLAELRQERIIQAARVKRVGEPSQAFFPKTRDS